MDQLTSKETAKVFAMYLGCEVVFDNEDEATGEEYLHSVQISGCGDTNQSEWDLISNPISLVLTPLSKLSGEHALQLATRTDYERKYNTEKLDYQFSIIENRGFKIGNVSNEASFFWHSLNWKQHQYLIDKRYAVPLWFGVNHWANGKTAIELNIATEKI